MSIQQPTRQSLLRHKITGAFKLTFWSGPRLLLTSRLSLRTAGFMIAAAVPAIICTTVMTVPALVYTTPESNAYFYFGRIMQSDPVSWIPMGVAAFCSVLALAVPTSTPARPFLQQL
jgi:hypothetical protein